MYWLLDAVLCFVKIKIVLKRCETQQKKEPGDDLCYTKTGATDADGLEFLCRVHYSYIWNWQRVVFPITLLLCLRSAIGWQFVRIIITVRYLGVGTVEVSLSPPVMLFCKGNCEYEGQCVCHLPSSEKKENSIPCPGWTTPFYILKFCKSQ